ncbi:MAG: hypothetical protein EOO50_15065 [Flavobacterium sp.]|uniref:hypothetical protein n=1 Tax=Flavobacterium sp. TaxID=239 RepID=UPI001206673E|nr:hypothetical protein [Flavobacterium sp.]RZJ65094.1 MAG: hypothetical protein EOO50_15065 [Flavobacterium sp.]
MRIVQTLTAVVFMLASCSQADCEFCALDVQRIDNGKFRIYEYCLASEFAFTGESYGTLILRKDEKFDIDSGYEVNGSLLEWISKDTLSICRFGGNTDQPRDTIAKITYEKLDDLTIKVFQYSGCNAAKVSEYSFDKITRDRNELTFHDVQNEYNAQELGTMRFKLGNIKFDSNADTLTLVSLTRIETGMDFTYHNPDGSYDKNLPRVEVTTVKLYPRKRIDLGDLDLDRVMLYAVR